MDALTIGKVAREANVGVETIRFYERKKLIRRPLRPRSGGFRHYPEETVGRIRFIRRAQELGFSLLEIGEFLALKAAPGTDCSQVRDRAKAKLGEVDAKIEHLQGIRAALQELISVCPGRGALRACTIMESLASVVEGNGDPSNANGRETTT